MPLGMLWPALLEEAHSRALKAEESAGLVEKQVVAPLAEAVRDLDIVRKALLAAGAREQKALQEMHTALRTAQSQYLRDKEVSDLSATKLARARSDPSKRAKELTKLQDKWEAASVRLSVTGDNLARREAECEERVHAGGARVVCTCARESGAWECMRANPRWRARLRAGDGGELHDSVRRVQVHGDEIL